jgi:hypothetical protein
MQFLGENAWPIGKGVENKVLEAPDHFYHIGRPEYQIGNSECPYDMDAMVKEGLDMAEFEAFLALLDIYSD